jgi:hypothetical protein
VKGTQVLWFDPVGRILVRIGIPIELTAPMRPPASMCSLLSYIEGSRCFISIHLSLDTRPLLI